MLSWVVATVGSHTCTLHAVRECVPEAQIFVKRRENARLRLHSTRDDGGWKLDARGVRMLGRTHGAAQFKRCSCRFRRWTSTVSVQSRRLQSVVTLCNACHKSHWSLPIKNPSVFQWKAAGDCTANISIFYYAMSRYSGAYSSRNLESSMSLANHWFARFSLFNLNLNLDLLLLQLLRFILFNFQVQIPKYSNPIKGIIKERNEKINQDKRKF